MTKIFVMPAKAGFLGYEYGLLDMWQHKVFNSLLV